jgi:hypothetical protein
MKQRVNKKALLQHGVNWKVPMKQRAYRKVLLQQGVNWKVPMKQKLLGRFYFREPTGRF